MQFEKTGTREYSSVDTATLYTRTTVGVDVVWRKHPEHSHSITVKEPDRDYWELLFQQWVETTKK